MKIYGYLNGVDNDQPNELSEITLLLSIEEIQEMINFLKYVKQKHNLGSKQKGFSYTHLKDWKKDTRRQVDVIIATED